MPTGGPGFVGEDEELSFFYTEFFGLGLLLFKGLDLNLVLPICKALPLCHLSHTFSPFFALVILEMGSCKLFA
jgi:hypothetical protein